MAGHTRDGRNYEEHITNVCPDHEFPIPEGDAGLDGEEYPCAAPLLSEADRSGAERVAAAYESDASRGARARPIGFSKPLSVAGRSASPRGIAGWHMADRFTLVSDRPEL